VLRRGRQGRASPKLILTKFFRPHYQAEYASAARIGRMVLRIKKITQIQALKRFRVAQPIEQQARVRLGLC
jgi:hypothetical protein